MVKFSYEVDKETIYKFTFFDERSAQVIYPDETTSEEDGLSQEGFADWVDTIIGPVLPPEYLSLFQYIFRQELKNTATFGLSETWLKASRMSDTERDNFKAEANELSNRYFALTGKTFDPGEVQDIWIARYKLGAFLILNQFHETVSSIKKISK